MAAESFAAIHSPLAAAEPRRSPAGEEYAISPEGVVLVRALRQTWTFNLDERDPDLY